MLLWRSSQDKFLFMALNTLAKKGEEAAAEFRVESGQDGCELEQREESGEGGQSSPLLLMIELRSRIRLDFNHYKIFKGLCGFHKHLESSQRALSGGL